MNNIIKKITFTRLFLLFSFFISFAIINFPSSKWGLQMSWFIAIIMLLIFPQIIGYKFRISYNRNFKYVCTFFIILILLSITSLIFQSLNVIKFKDIDIIDLRSRSIPHCIYLIFEFIIYLFLTAYLTKHNNQRDAVIWFITYPFYIITIYGIYQWLTTFDLVPYTAVFNNNESTGFTYLRFKDSHRCCSVFPEPSEYAYYLGFMLPFILTPFYNKNITILPVFFKKKKLALCLYTFAVLSAGSMSLFAVFPIILFVVVRKFIKVSRRQIIFISIISIIILVTIVLLQRGRISEMMAGDDGSAITRYEALVETLNLFKGSPLIGGGFGAVRGLDLFSFMLGTTGLIGTSYFIFMIYKLRAISDTNKIFKTALICMLIVALMSNPIIDHTFFWPILAFNTVQINYIS